MELYFIDGRPDGMLTAEIFNWTGHVLVAPRTRIADALTREETTYTGVYILLGEKDGNPFGYIGETEHISKRIRRHELKKDWWDVAIIITSAGNQLNKAHVRYLEARLIQEAVAVGRLNLENDTRPKSTGLSEAATSNMEAFLEHLLLVLPAVRIDYFLRQTRPTPERGRLDNVSYPVFELKVPKHNIHAVAQLINGEFVVQEGSRARKGWVAKGRTQNHSYKRLYEDLVAAQILIEQGEHRVFAENYAFQSPSAAAAVVTGRITNGRRAWKVLDRTQTYRQWEEEQLAQVEPGDED